ncbi:SprB repeat-containing protein [Aquimarina sp. AU474]|uniref:SprB repeat-containing protein n=1 Tax=Aquimarina sp. AU474 TaxID=2108529 RepID=UPI000D6869B8|nr:SprB repeat-containing protein [Aquimarina sp. AU474]
MKKLKIILIIATVLNFSVVFAQDYVVKVTPSGPPAGGDVRFAITRLEYKMFSGATQVDSYSFISDQATFPTAIMTSNQRVTRIQLEFSYQVSSSSAPYSCSITEDIILSGTQQDCYKRTFTNSRCSLDVELIHTKAAISQPVNDSFCLDDGLTFTRINDCTNASYRWFYNIDSAGTFRDTGVSTVGRQPAVIPFGRLIPSNYRGSIRLRARITIRGVNYNSNIVVFNTLPCAPEISRIIPRSASCGRSNGGLTINFREAVNQEMLFIIRERGRPVESVQQYVGGSSFVWPTNKGLRSGRYTLTYQPFPGEAIDQPGTIVIGDTPKIRFSAFKTEDVQCFGEITGRLTITASNGNGRYQYKVNGGPWRNFTSGNRHVLTGLAGRQNYRIEVQDTSGCEGETASGNVGENVFINGPADGVTFRNVRITDITFRGDNTGAINLTVSGGSRPYNYQWSNGSTTEDISGLRAGFYTLVVTDNNDCVFTSPRYEVTEPDALNVNIEIDQVVSCTDDTNGVLEANPSGGIASAGYQYEWTKTGDPSFGRTTKRITNLSAGTYNVTISNVGAPSTSDAETLVNPATLSFSSLTVQDVLCFGERTGAIRFTISGGRRPYTINWSNGVTQTTNGSVAFVNQPRGEYSFQILDTENCAISSTDPISITEEDEIIIDVDGLGIQGPTTVNGTNGAIDIEVSGGTGTGTYTYTWTSDQFGGTITTEDLSNLTEGNYTVTITDANNCPKIRNFELKDPEPLEASIQIDQDILCFGQKANLTAIVQGGVTNSAQSHSYQWYVIESGVPVEITGETNRSITGLDEGIYEVMATDIVGVSKISDRETFIEPSEIILGGTHIDVFCNGGNNGSIDLTANGGTGVLTYSWSKQEDVLFNSTDQDLNNLTSGTYIVEVRDENIECVKRKTFVVTQPDNPLTIIDSSQENVKIFDESTGSISITVSGGTLGYIYKWTKLEDLGFLSTEKDLTNIKAGNYTVEIVDANINTTTSNAGCMTSMDFEITQPDKLEVEITIGNPLDCFEFVNGVLDANAIGGIEDQPYSYNWFKITDGQEVEITQGASLSFAENLGSGSYKVIVEDVNGAIASDTFIFEEPDKIVVSLIGTTGVKCFGESNGSLRLNIVGGTPFDDDTYILELYRNGNFYTNGSFPVGDVEFDDLPEGNYEITVQDKNGCPQIEVPDAIKVIQPDAPLRISDVDVIDLTGFETQNGIVTVTVSGGTKEYKYEWRRENETSIIGRESTIDNLPIGNYEVTVIDANDCTTNGLYTLEQPDKLEVTVDYPSIGGRVSCNGAKDAILEAAVTGGVPFDLDTNPYYHYQWYEDDDPSLVIGTNQILNNIGKGNYFVIVTDINNNITKSLTFEVEEPSIITINITSTTNITCFNDASGGITVEVSGGTPFDNGEYLYNWSNGDTTKDVSNLLAGNYFLTVTDRNGCQMNTADITLNEPGPLTITEISRVQASSSIARDGSITINVTSGTPPYNYEWYDPNGAQFPSNTNTLTNTGNGEYFVTITDANLCVIERRNIDDPIAGLSVDIVQINPVLCQGSNTASLRANVMGGIPFSSNDPFIYTWYEEGNPNSIGEGRVVYELPIGNYYVIIEDAVGDTIQSDVYEINGPPVELEVTLATDYVNCGDQNDWTITATVVGGVQPYNYFWQNGFSVDQELIDVPSGTYTLVIQDARGCIAQTTITTFDPVPLEANISGTDPLCYQGSTGMAEIEALGGVPPYTYVWSTGAVTASISNIPEGDYFVEVMDNKGCTIIKEITLIDPNEILLDIGPDNKILCQGQTYTVDASIDDPSATYRWTSGKGFESFDAEVTLSEEANYQIEITTGLGCIATANLSITVRETPLIAEFLLSSDVFVNQGFVLANVSYPTPDRVEWTFPEKTQVIDIDDTYAEIQFSEIGEYKVSMTVYLDGCQETFSETIIVREQSTSSDDDTGNFLKDFTIYPIPTDGNFTIEMKFKEVVPISFNIYSVVSNTPVLATAYKNDGASEYSIPMSLKGQNLPPGVYFIILEVPGKRYVHKIVIE